MLQSEFNHVSRSYEYQRHKVIDIATLKELLTGLKESRIASHLTVIQNSLRCQNASLTHDQWRKLNTAVQDIRFIRQSLQQALSI